jgi:hypothetical protein
MTSASASPESAREAASVRSSPPMRAYARVRSWSGAMRAMRRRSAPDRPWGTPNTSGRDHKGRQRSGAPGPPSGPRTRDAQAPRSTRLRSWRSPTVTTGVQTASSRRMRSSVPGGQSGGRAQTVPVRNVPRGHPASAGTQAERPCATSGVLPSSQARPAARTPDFAMHAPVAASSTLPSAQGRNAHPPGAYRAAGPQYASATAGGTHAPRTGTLPETQSQRPLGPRAASRGHAAEQLIPLHGRCMTHALVMAERAMVLPHSLDDSITTRTYAC